MNIVFDFGGVVFRWRPAQLLREALPQRIGDDATARHWAAQIFQSYQGDWRDFDLGLVAVPELVRRLAARTGLALAEVQAVVDAVPGELAPLADSVALVGRLRAATRADGRGLYYLSNMPAPVADHLERSHDFLRDFDDGVFSGRVQLAKPDAEVFHYAARRFGVAPADLVFLDDHEPNVQAARAAGWKALHFTDAARCEAALRAQGWWPGAA